MFVGHVVQQKKRLRARPCGRIMFDSAPRFVDEHDPIWTQERLLPLALLPRLGDIRPPSLLGDEGFFRFRRSRLITEQGVRADTSLPSQALSFRSVGPGLSRINSHVWSANGAHGGVRRSVRQE